jgi:hypothetical protein
MTDRELLEAAAHAYGLYSVDPRGDDDLWEVNATGEDGWPTVPSWGMRTIEGSWNPLTDDGDALRLAVKLRISLIHEEETMGGFTIEAIGDERADGSRHCETQYLGEDPAAATRRAIVRAAAALHPDGGNPR